MIWIALEYQQTFVDRKIEIGNIRNQRKISQKRCRDRGTVKVRNLGVGTYTQGVLDRSNGPHKQVVLPLAHGPV